MEQGRSKVLRNNDFREYREDEELYVYDQSCQNCRYYCDWDDKEHNGCKYFSREDYEQYPRSNWCCDWRGRRSARSSQGGRGSRR